MSSAQIAALRNARKTGDRDTETAPEAEKAGEGKQVMKWKLLMLTLGQMPVYLAPVNVDDDGGGDNIDDDDPENQIGRASCRERV